MQVATFPSADQYFCSSLLTRPLVATPSNPLPMYRRFPGNVLILLTCFILIMVCLFHNNILSSSICIPEYLNHPSQSTIETPTIIDPLHLQDRHTTTTLSLYTTASCTCPVQQILDEPLTIEQQTITRLRAHRIVVIFKTGAAPNSWLTPPSNSAPRCGTCSPSEISFFSDFQSFSLAFHHQRHPPKREQRAERRGAGFRNLSLDHKVTVYGAGYWRPSGKARERQPEAGLEAR